MPYLYCAACGHGHENRVSGQERLYRDEGESVLIVKGTLTGGPHRCDMCNAPLKKGDAAALLSAFPRHIVESQDGYDFACERRYFDMKRAEAKLYGTPWPGVASAAARRSG